ncbi:hypothetical protein NX059_004241 [Plenodomus lindquistii]|nr:hypothetical protein NX059_004241 [Plenodomus lindquistii]
MAQKRAQPSAWTRQNEVMVGQPATAILVENARNVKAEVALIEQELADEAAEKLEEDDSKGGDKTNAKPTDHKNPTEDAFADNSDYIDDVADANDARRATEAPGEEGKVNLPVLSLKTTAPTTSKTVDSDANQGSTRKDQAAISEAGKASRGRASSSGPASEAQTTKPKDDIKKSGAAARFPDLVANCPQRTYAILTKYDALRSLVARKPAPYTALHYKALYKRLGEQVYGVQTKLLENVPWDAEEKENVAAPTTAVTRMGNKGPATGLYPHADVKKYSEDPITRLGDARIAIRRQMARIVNEVDLMEKNPKLASDEDHVEPHQSPLAFEDRLPIVHVPERFRVKVHPLSGQRLTSKTLTEVEQAAQAEKEAKMAEGGPLYTGGVDPNEQASSDKFLASDPDLKSYFQASFAVGDSKVGTFFLIISPSSSLIG